MKRPRELVKDRRVQGAAVAGLVVLLGFSFLLLEAPQKREKEERVKVVEGGVIGGPVQIGGSRVQVVEGNRSGVEIEIYNGSAHPGVVNISSPTTVYFRNLQGNVTTVNFIGFRKMASLAPNQSYEIRFNRAGTYSYAVSGAGFSDRGKVVVR